MFFRRERPKTLTFDDHMANARAAGFKTGVNGWRQSADPNATAWPAVVEPGR